MHGYDHQAGIDWVAGRGMPARYGKFNMQCVAREQHNDEDARKIETAHHKTLESIVAGNLNGR